VELSAVAVEDVADPPLPEIPLQTGCRNCERKFTAEADVPGGHVALLIEGANEEPDSYWTSASGILVITEGSRSRECLVDPSMHCVGKLDVERRGSLILACVPQQDPHGTDASDCSTSSRHARPWRSCALVDLARSSCFQFRWHFDDVRFVSRTRLQVDARRYHPLAGSPTSVHGLIDLPPVCKRCPEPTLVRAELEYSGGGFRLAHVIGDVAQGLGVPEDDRVDVP
jgi:hypothetical protein